MQVSNAAAVHTHYLGAKPTHLLLALIIIMLLQFQKIVGNKTNYTHTVGADNYYLLYEVAVQAYNSYDGSKRIFYGPRSDNAYIHSSEGSEY